MAFLDKAGVERAARLYSTTGDAARALGCAPGSFLRACKRLGIKTPSQRKKIARAKAKEVRS